MARITNDDLTNALRLLKATAERAGITAGREAEWVLAGGDAGEPYTLFWVTEGTARTRCPIFSAGTLGATKREAWATMHTARVALLAVPIEK